MQYQFVRMVACICVNVAFNRPCMSCQSIGLTDCNCDELMRPNICNWFDMFDNMRVWMGHIRVLVCDCEWLCVKAHTSMHVCVCVCVLLWYSCVRALHAALNACHLGWMWEFCCLYCCFCCFCCWCCYCCHRFKLMTNFHYKFYIHANICPAFFRPINDPLQSHCKRQQSVQPFMRRPIFCGSERFSLLVSLFTIVIEWNFIKKVTTKIANVLDCNRSAALRRIWFSYYTHSYTYKSLAVLVQVRFVFWRVEFKRTANWKRNAFTAPFFNSLKRIWIDNNNGCKNKEMWPTVRL